MTDQKMPQRSYSPGQLALRRLMGHRLALVGLICFIGVVLFVLFGHLLVNTNAEENRPWACLQPPGFQHPHCRDEMFFTVGEKPRLEPVYDGVNKLDFRIVKSEKTTVILGFSDGNVVKIDNFGGEPITRLDLAGVADTVYEIGVDGLKKRRIPNCMIEIGKPAPAELAVGDRQGFTISWRRVIAREELTVDLDNGVVNAMTRTKDGKSQSLNTAAVRGEEVEEVLADGTALTLYHPLGTDPLGRDVLLRVVTGGRVSLLVGLVATLVSLIIGVAYGAVSGYIGGAVDGLMMRFVDVLYGLPFIFLVLLLMMAFDRSIILLFVALGMVQWLTTARIVRGHVLSLREAEFVDAARMSGAGDAKIVFRHILPHTLGPVIVYATLTVPAVILEESFLAFIGLPVQYNNTTLDSWGALVRFGMSSLGESGENWWLLVFPALAMVITLFSLNCVGDGLRDSLDPKHAND